MIATAATATPVRHLQQRHVVVRDWDGSAAFVELHSRAARAPHKLPPGSVVKAEAHLLGLLGGGSEYKTGKFIAAGNYGNVYKLFGSRVPPSKVAASLQPTSEAAWTPTEGRVIKQMHESDAVDMEDRLASAYSKVPRGDPKLKNLAMMEPSFIGAVEQVRLTLARMVVCALNSHCAGSPLGRFSDATPHPHIISVVLPPPFPTFPPTFPFTSDAATKGARRPSRRLRHCPGILQVPSRSRPGRQRPRQVHNRPRPIFDQSDQ